MVSLSVTDGLSLFFPAPESPKISHKTFTWVFVEEKIKLRSGILAGLGVDCLSPSLKSKAHLKAGEDEGRGQLREEGGHQEPPRHSLHTPDRAGEGDHKHTYKKPETKKKK